MNKQKSDLVWKITQMIDEERARAYILENEYITKNDDTAGKASRYSWGIVRGLEIARDLLVNKLKKGGKGNE